MKKLSKKIAVRLFAGQEQRINKLLTMNQTTSDFVREAVEEKLLKMEGTNMIEKYIEMLQEMGKVCVDDVKDVEKLQKEIGKRGYMTQLQNTDRLYLALVNKGINPYHYED